MTSSIPAANSAAPLLDVQDLQVNFVNGRLVTPAVRGISFQLGKEKLAIVGESGSGKSTVGRALLQLHPRSAQVTAQRMQFGDVDLLCATPAQMRAIRGKRISMIMQDPKYSLNPVVRVGEQIAEAWRSHHPGQREVARQRAMEMLDVVQVRDPGRIYQCYPHEISGGQGQRVMIAMMLLAKPRMVIADEPTSALDVSVRGDVLKLLDELVRENNAGLMLISHDIRMVAAFCERIMVMYKGRVVETLTSLEEAQHPYTRGLIAAMPDLKAPVRRLKTLDRNAIDAVEVRP